MKKWISLLLTAMLLLSLMLSAVSCGGKNTAPEETPQTETPQTETPQTETPQTETPPEEGEGLSPLMWRVTDQKGHTLYLFGTIHAGDERNDAVLRRVAPVLESCEALAVEFDVVAYANDFGQMMRDMEQYVLMDGTTVEDHMPQELYERAYELIDKAKMRPGLFKRYNLSWWMQMVQSAMMEVYGRLDSEKGMDSLLIRHAYDKEIPVLDVESSAFQSKLLNSFDRELYLLMIEGALESAEEFDSGLNELYELWLAGDREGLWNYLAAENEDTEDVTPEQVEMIREYNRRMLDERNEGMCQRAVEYLNGGKTVFFAVGAAHMAGETGLVHLLSQAGCTVEQIEYGT